VLVPRGIRPKGVRLDSGDLAYLSKKIRKILDDAGFADCKICVSNALDEKLITSLLNQGACIDSFGVGENLITAKSDPVFGAVYKLVAIQEGENIIPKIKISETRIVNLQESPFFVPSIASCERVFAPSQYQIRLALVIVTSPPFRLEICPKNTPDLSPRTM